MTVRYDIGGCATLAVEGEGPATSWIRRAMDPYAPTGVDERDGDVILTCAAEGQAELPDIQNTANDSLVTAADASAFYLLARSRVCTLTGFLPEQPLHIRYQPGYPLGGLFRRIVRPALQLAMPARGCVAVHGAAAELDGAAIVVAGWSESGKTETALALAELDGRFVADKWTVLRTDLSVAPFPISVGVRRWVVKYLPRLHNHLPWPARVQLRLAGAAAVLTLPVRRRPGVVADVTERVVSLGDRAGLRLSQLYAAYGRVDTSAGVPLRTLALLRNASDPSVTVERVAPEWAAWRLAGSAAYERRSLAELHARRAYARAAATADPVREAEALERELLVDMLARVDVLDVRAPFPADPRRVAEAILRAL
jgi:hypothetical protein